MKIDHVISQNPQKCEHEQTRIGASDAPFSSISTYGSVGSLSRRFYRDSCSTFSPSARRWRRLHRRPDIHAPQRGVSPARPAVPRPFALVGQLRLVRSIAYHVGHALHQEMLDFLKDQHPSSLRNGWVQLYQSFLTDFSSEWSN